MSGPSLVLMKMGMGRYPAVNVVVPAGLLTEVAEYYFRKKTAISYVVGAGVKPESADPTNAIYIADLESTSTHLALLLVRGDPGRAIPGFVNPIRRVVRPATADDPNFVPGASCHLVISKQEIASGTDQGRFRVVMERTRGISRVLARDFLTQLMGRFAEEFPDRFLAEKKQRRKGEKPETVPYRPTVRFHPQENGSLKKDLQEGKIGGFKLTRGSTEFKGEANEAALQRLDVQLQARIVPTRNFSRVKRLVDHLQQAMNAISFESLKLELVDDDGQRLENTRSIDIEDLDDGDMRYCKSVPILNVGADLQECYGVFHAPIKAFAVKVLRTDSNWT